MMTEERTTVRGKHYTVTDALGIPKPLQRPHPPLMIGGTGEKVLLRIVAKYADMWNATGSGERLRGLIDVIRRHGDAAQIEKTAMMPLAYRAPKVPQDFMCQLVASMQQTTPDVARKNIMIGDEQECFDTIERYRAAGITHFIFMTFTPLRARRDQAFAEDVIPAVRAA